MGGGGGGGVRGGRGGEEEGGVVGSQDQGLYHCPTCRQDLGTTTALKMSMAILAKMAKNGSYGHYGHDHFQVKHDNDWYPQKEC